MTMPVRAVLFDLLTALLDSWSLWDEAAGSVGAGRAWRGEYLRMTYSCGVYRPYEQLLREAAAAAGLSTDCAERLEKEWDSLSAWSEAHTALAALAGRIKLGVVTNCSSLLGYRAAARVNVPWAAIVTAEDAGFYKPHPQPYRMALAKLGVTAEQTLFVAGSGYDLFGTHAVGLRTFWHNRIGLPRPRGAPAPDREERTLQRLPDWVFESV